MIGLVLVTHGRLAAEFVVAMEHVVGPQEAIEAICIGADDDMEARRQDIAEAITKVDDGKGVIILTDLFGGTPSNLAISLMKSENIEVIAGVNLPMLIRLEGARKVMGVHAAVAAAREARWKYISVASEVLGETAPSTRCGADIPKPPFPAWTPRPARSAMACRSASAWRSPRSSRARTIGSSW